jgi:putative ABC transport system permease protein
MSALRRLPMLTRLAARYARRHRGQSVRAVLGLVVVALVVTTGLGLGDSLGASLESGIVSRFGPVDVVARGPAKVGEAELLAAMADPSVAAHGARGVATLSLVGSVSDPARARAEAFASVRGVAPGEALVLGPLPGGAAEPTGEGLVLSSTLAERLQAEVGDRVVLRILPVDLNETAGLRSTGLDGTLGTDGRAERGFAVPEGARIVLATLAGDREGPVLRIVLRTPSGQELQPLESGREAGAAAPLEAGNWTLVVTGPAGAAFNATLRVATDPPDLASLVVVLEGTVQAIAPTEGRTAATPRPTVLVPLARLQQALGLEGQANQAYLTASDPEAAAEALEALLGNATWTVSAVKSEAVERIRRDAGNLSGFILVMGAFAIVASLLLAYLLFGALVEERRAELGIARALGLTRGEVATAMVVEALLYAAVAAALGVALGAGIVHALVALVDSYAAQYGAPDFFVRFAPTSLPVAFLAGLLLPLATIALGTIRFARLDPSRAIRGAPEDVRIHRRSGAVAGLAVLGLGLALCLDPYARLAGVGVAAGGLALALLAFRQRAAAVILCAGAIAYTLWTLYSFDDFPPLRRELDPILTMGRSLVVTLLAATVLMAYPGPVRRLAGAFARLRGMRRGAYVAFRYLAARRVQAGLTAAMVAVVAVVVTVMGVLAAIFAASLERDEGGYDVVGQSPFPLTGFPGPLDAADADAIARADFIPEHRPLAQLRMLADDRPFREGRFVRFAGASPDFAAANAYEVLDRHGRYATDRAAWDAVARGEAVLAPPWYFDDEGLRAGGTFTLRAGGVERTYTVAGMLPEARRGNLYLAYDHVVSMGFPQTATVLVRVQPGTDAAALAHGLTERYQEQGLVFESVAEEVREAEDAVRATVLILQAFLFLCVLVGISSTGFLAARAVHERRREVGTLRALGYEARDVARAFLLESVLVAAVGLALGIAVGLVVAHSIWWRSVRTFGGDFLLPWDVLGAFAVLVLGLTAVAAWRPARRAAALDPAEAVRHVE